MLADVALSDDVGDKLGFKPFADAIAGIIDSPRTATPLVMAINAKWGAGKTTLGQMIKWRLETKSAADGHAPHITCWFAAWMHDDAPTLSTALAAEVAQVANRSRSLMRRIVNPLPSGLSTAGGRKFRKGFKYLATLVLLGLFCVIFLQNGFVLRVAARLDPEVVRLLTTLKGSTYLAGVTIFALFILFKGLASILPVAKSVAEFAKDPQTSAKTASMQDVRGQLGKLIKHATPKGSKFVIFIDDLDRCRPPRSIDVLEAINQLLDHTGVVVVIMSDMQVIAKCAEIKYKDLATLDAPPSTNYASPGFSTYGWSFIQKIIQLQFDLPTYAVKLIRQMIVDLAREVPEQRNVDWWHGVFQNSRIRVRRGFSRLPWARIRLEAITYGLVLAGVALPLVVPKIRSLLFGDKLNNFGRTTLLVTAWVLTMLLLEGTVLIVTRMSQSKRRRQIDKQIKARIAAGERDFSKVEAYVRRENSAWRNDREAEGLVRERLQRYLEDESEIQREAEDEVMRHLEPMPRHAKRLLNRLRLLLFVAHERKMFGGSPELSSRHIAKWVVLGERWPELAQIVCTNPEIMRRLESVKKHDLVIKERVPLYENDKALRRFCLSRFTIKLWPVIGRIVEFTPFTNQERKSQRR
jgi:hypothetical protein